MVPRYRRDLQPCGSGGFARLGFGRVLHRRCVPSGGPTPETIAALARAGITVSSPGQADAPLDMDARGLTSVIRIAPHVFSTVGDIDALVEVLEWGSAGNSS